MAESYSSVRKLAAIMFADIVGYTALMQADESRAKQLRDRHREVMEGQVNAYGGEIVQYYGDGALCLFNSAKEAVVAAGEIQRSLLTDPLVPHRIGIHLGDIVRDEAGIYGDGVNIASRIESLAIPGAVLFSDKVCAELENHPSIKTKSLGEFQLKNVKRPVEVFALDDAGINVPDAASMSSGVAQRQTKRIAVIPFSCLEKNDEGEYFADGVSEEIVHGLSKVDGLSVMSRSTGIAIRESGEDPIQIGRRFNISHVLEGRVRKAGTQVRVSLQLVNTADGFHAWSESFNGSLEHIFELQDDIAQKVVRSMRVSFNLPEESDPIVERQTSDSEAHQLYMKGLHHWNRRNPENVRKATELFQEALAVDADYSSAQCALSNCYAFLGSCGALPPTDAYAKALKYAMQAIEVNPRNAEAHLAIANIKFYHYWDWEGTRTSLEKALSLNLNTGLMHQSYGLYCAAMGNHREGIDKMRQALELDPVSIPVMTMLGTLYLFDEQFDKAISLYDEILELEPTFRSAYEYKGVALACMGMYEEALAAFIKYHDMVGHPQKGVAGLVLASHALGDYTMANEYIERLNARLIQEPNAAVEIDLAIVHSGIGNYEEAMKYLNRVYEKRFSIACMGMIWIHRCPYFKEIWKTPEFKELKAKMGLPG